MCHHHHSVLGRDLQVPQPILWPTPAPPRRNRSLRANCTRPSATVTFHPSSAAIVTTGIASSPAPSTNSRCGSASRSTKTCGVGQSQSPIRNPTGAIPPASKPSLLNSHTTIRSHNSATHCPPIRGQPGRYTRLISAKRSLHRRQIARHSAVSAGSSKRSTTPPQPSPKGSLE